MFRIMAELVKLAWALWLGGLVALFLFAQTLFAQLPDRASAGTAASTLFVFFGRYQIFLAAILLLGAFYTRWKTPSRRSTVLFILLAVATILTAGVSGWLIPKINAMRLEHLTADPLFRRLHGLSSMLMSIEALLLVAVGPLLPRIAATRGETAANRASDA